MPRPLSLLRDGGPLAAHQIMLFMTFGAVSITTADGMKETFEIAVN